jgi:glucosamine-6-phosphate isomerase
MKIVIADSYNELSARAADDIVEKMAQTARPLICPASGDSPAGLYSQLVQRVQSGRVEIGDWSFVGLDEWGGMNGTDEGSCRYHLNAQLFFPLNVPEERISFFDGRKDPQQECEKAERFISEQGGIAVAVVGLGMNGHVGMNEPGTPAWQESHEAEIAASTGAVGQKYFTKAQQLTKGVTLGLATIMKAEHVLLIVNGSHKATIVHQALEGDISAEIPASLLRNHPDFTVYLDQPAASLLSHE